MCRALLYLGQPVLLDHLLFQPDSALVRQSYMPKMLHMLNLAGFGLRAWDRTSPATSPARAANATWLPVASATRARTPGFPTKTGSCSQVGKTTASGSGPATTGAAEAVTVGGVLLG